MGKCDNGGKCNCGDDCKCGGKCKCGDGCKCGGKCKCGDDCECGDDCKCGDDCECEAEDSCGQKKYDVIIVGAGIAGMTAAIYAKRAGKSVLVLEAQMQGGQIINTLKIGNWPGEPGISGPDLINKIYHQMNKLGVKMEYEEVMSVDDVKEGFVVKTDEAEYSCGAIILAVGSEPRKLELAREDELAGRGVSYCATCDGAFYKNKTVAVIGGGNTALYDALYLADLAKKVYVVHRREEFRGDKVLVERLKAKENVEFVLGYVPEEILGEGKVEGLKVKNAEAEKKLDVDGIFVAIGEKPVTDKFVGLVKLDDSGYVVAGEDCKTSKEGVLAAGDCRVKTVRQLVTAASDGAIAAGAAVDYLG